MRSGLKEGATIATKGGLVFVLTLIIIQVMLAGAFAIDGESFWIDELDTRAIADVANFPGWIESYLNRRDAHLQVPLYQFYVFSWHKLFGLSEYSLRLANLPIYFVGLLIVAVLLRRQPTLSMCAVFTLGFHPLIWYYLNEARPYVMFYMGTAISLAGLYALHSSRDSHGKDATQALTALVLGLVLMGGSTILGLPWSLSALLVGVWIWRARPTLPFNGASWFALACGSALLLAWSAFYLYTIFLGIQSTILFETNLQTLLFSAYELAGLGGLGPGRLELRENGIAALPQYMWPLMVGTVVVVGIAIYSLMVVVREMGRKHAAVILFAIVLPIALTVVAGYLLHWRVLGRHLIPIAAVLAFLIAFGLRNLLASHNALRKFSTVIIAVSLVFGAFSYRSARHDKEDYRAASMTAANYLHDGHSVWWVGSHYGAQLYGLPLQTAEVNSKTCPDSIDSFGAVLAIDFRESCTLRLQSPEYVFMSRPIVFDQHGAMRNKLRDDDYTQVTAPHGFTLWYRARNEAAK